MINWEEQWAYFAHRFVDGKAHIELPNGEEIELLPGPGFGDYSHPTTQLMIELMAEQVSDQIVFDIGCGSGILSVAAAKMGAKKVYAVDIEPEALDHTMKNGEHNGVQIITSQRPSGRPLILMNMIQSEQEIAWKMHGRPFSKSYPDSLQFVNFDRAKASGFNCFSEGCIKSILTSEKQLNRESFRVGQNSQIGASRGIITSGILLSDLDNYIEFAQANGWRLISQRESADWAAFIFEEKI